MSANVFANSREISAKKDSNKSMGAMPDVCLSPPSPPAGPVPIPYPNFAMGSDTSGGTKQVKIKGQEAGIKNNSNYKKSKGNEAATRSFGMGVVSHALSGKMQHAAWSMDVKFEGKNVIRLLDLTTHNHGSQTNGALTANGGQWKPAERQQADCDKLKTQTEEAEKQLPGGELPENKVIASAQYNPPSGASFTANAFSNLSKVKNKDGFVQGFSGEQGKSNLCEEADFNYKGGGHTDPRTHCESRFIEDICMRMGSRPGGTLVMRIKWNDGGLPRNDPCRVHCRRLICAATKCLNIKLCMGDPEKPTDPPCDQW